MTLPRQQLDELLPVAQAATVAWFLARLSSPDSPAENLEDDVTSGWQSADMARFAIEQSLSMARGCEIEGTAVRPGGEVRCALRDRRQRSHELLLTFESADSPRLASLCVRPILPDDVEVRRPGPDDAAEMRRLELAAPVRRDDDTEVIIDHAGRQLAAFSGGRMLAVQAVAITAAPINGTMNRVAYNHYSRSDPATRNSGNLIHLVATLYRDIYPIIDQFASLVDVQNPTGLRLSFGIPWQTLVRRLFLSTAALAARRQESTRRTPFDPIRAAELLNATHEGMNLWKPRTADFLMERHQRAPGVYGPECWRMTPDSVLALWRSGERRTYRKGDSASTRTLALVLDYGFTGDQGRPDLTDLLSEAAVELVDEGISHLALFVSDEHPGTKWLMELADAFDTYAICAPILQRPAPPAGPVYVDQVIF